jgi:hypothetical protein
MATLMKDDFLLTSCGSPHYASPEVVMGHKYAGRKSDIWSCGVILFAMTTGKLPFDDDNIRRLLAKVKNGVFTIPKFLNPEVADLIQRMLVADPARRISIKEIKEHPYWLSRTFSPPRVIVPVEELLLDSAPVTSPEVIDEEIVLSLMSLGWSTEDEEALIAKLSSERCLELVFYRILERQKLHSAKLPQEEKKTNTAPPSFQDPTTPRQRSGSRSSADGNESDKIPAVSSSSSSSTSGTAKPSDGPDEENRCERRRLPRDKRQGSVKNLIALLGRKPTQPDLKQVQTNPTGHPKVNSTGKENVDAPQVEVTVTVESSRPKKKSKLRIDESNKEKSKEKVKGEKVKEKASIGDRIGAMMHRHKNGDQVDGKEAAHEAPLSERNEARRAKDKISSGDEIGNDERKSAGTEQMVVDVEKKEGDDLEIHRTSSSGLGRPRTKTAPSKSLWRNISSKGLRSIVTGAETPSPRATRIDESSSSSRVSRLAISGASSSSSSNTSSGEETARRSWFSTFIRQQKQPAGSIPTRVQLSTNLSRLNVVHQFINLLFGTNDVTFAFDSKKYRFTVEHSKVECRFTITLREESSSPMIDTERDRASGGVTIDHSSSLSSADPDRILMPLPASSPVALPSADHRDHSSREDQYVIPDASKTASSEVDVTESRGVRIAGDVEEGGGVGESSGKEQKLQKRYSAILSDSVSKRKSMRANRISVELHMDKLDPDLSPPSVVNRTLIDVDFKDGDLTLYQSVCNGLRKLLDL